MDEVRIQLEAAFETLGVPHTLTVDDGTEFYGHRELAAATGIRIFSRIRIPLSNAARSRTSTG